jgi:hypothetical protein
MIATLGSRTEVYQGGLLQKIQTYEHHAATLGTFLSLQGRPTVRYYKLEEPR